ncbi:hypothetical protein ACFMJ1_12935, partial [Acinetobacter baumannii]
MMNADITTRIEKDLIGHREINNAMQAFQ